MKPRRPWRRFAPRRVRAQYASERAYYTCAGFDPYIALEQMRAAGCTLFERRVVMMFLAHQSREIVARRLKMPFAVVTLAIQSATEKLAEWRRQQRDSTGFEGLREVYVQEVNRWSYEGEHHCKPGHEACAKDGLCKFRWYLTREEEI